MKMQTTLDQKLRESMEPLHIEIENESHKHHSGLGAESHFKMLVVSPLFQGLSRIDRQRKIYDLFKDEMKAIHALSLRLLTLEEWREGQGADFQTPNCQSKH